MMRLLPVLVLFTLLDAPAMANDIPWFDQAAAEELVRQSEPVYLAHIQERFQSTNPGRYANKLHKALAIVAGRHDQPELYQAWSRVCAAEVAYIQAAAAYRDAPPQQQEAMQPTLLPLAEEWESAIAALYSVKIPLTEDKLYNLESNLSDLQANFDAYVMDRVLNTTR